VADITARFRIDISGVDAALARVAAATLAVQGTFAAANAALAPFQQAFGAIKDSLDLGGRLSDVSAQTGIAVSDLVVLRQAFDNAGVGADGVGPAINRMQKALAGVTEEGEPSNEALVRLGLTMGEIRSLSPAEQFARVASGLAAITDPTERAATAMKIFGRKGGEMMALFRDSSAMATAAQQVGGLAAVMEANASQFDFISDALGAANVKVQQFSAGVTAGIAPALQELADSLNQTDLTGLGESVGQAAAGVIRLGQAMSQLAPQIIGVVAAIALYRSGFDAKVMTAMSTIGPAAARAFAQVRIAIASISFASIGTGARTAFASVAISARGAALAIKGALISTGVGAIIVAIGMAIEAVLGKVEQIKQGIRALGEASKETHSTITGLAAAVQKVSNEGDKVALGKGIDQEIEATTKALQELAETNEHLSQEDQDALGDEYRRRIQYLEQMRVIMQGIPPEVMAGRQAEKDRAAALEESRLKATELNKELGKNKEALATKIADDAFQQLSPGEQRSSLLGSAGAADTSALDAEIEALAAKRLSAGLTEEETIRMAALIESREKLIGIERNLASERKKSAEEAEAAERRRSEYEKESALELALLQALARGDKQTAQGIERDQKIDQETKRGESVGLTPEEARAAAIEKVDATSAAEAAAREEANATTREAIDLELALTEAKASGNDAEASRLEWLQRYNSELQRLRELMPEGQAQDMAQRFANANAAAGQAGGGEPKTYERLASNNEGVFVKRLTADPMVAEARKQQTLLTEIKGVLQQIKTATMANKPTGPLTFGAV